jgi:hypothetical protein
MKFYGLSRSMIAFALVISLGGSVFAGGKFSLFGDALKVPGATKKSVAIQLDSDIDGDYQYSGILFVPTRTKKKILRLEDMQTLAATYQIQAGGFGGGSARFTLWLDRDGDGARDASLHVNLGELPNFRDEPGSLTLTGNLINDPSLRFDCSGLGGRWYGTFDEALELAGDAEVLGVILVVDGFWAVDGDYQSVVVTTMQVNSDRLAPKTVKLINDDE